MIHEDERRTLEDFPEGKLITAKQACVIGNHYHKVKTESFILVSGIITIIRDGINEEMQWGAVYEVKPGVKHSFMMANESMMVGLCSHPYDPTDDYK